MNAKDLIALADRMDDGGWTDEPLLAEVAAALRACAADREKIKNLCRICRHVSHWLDKEAPDDFGILIGMLDDEIGRASCRERVYGRV